MAHFAELDENNVVVRVIVVNNKDTADENGVEQEEIGVAFCKSLFGEDTKWVQTSYNGNIRGRYAGIGDTYDSKKDIFVAPEPIVEVVDTPVSNPVVETKVAEPAEELE